MDQGGASIDKAMKAVSAGQVITQGEADSAEQMRLAQDRLSDSLGDLERQAGALLAQFAPLIDATSFLIVKYGGLVSAVDGVEGKLGPLGEAMKAMTNPVGFLGDAVHLFGGKAKDTKPPVDDLTKALKDSTTAADNMDAAYKAMSGALDQESALLRAKDAIDDLKKANVDAAHAATTGGADQVAAYRKAEESAITSKQAVIRYAQSIKDIPPAKVTEINAAIDRGDYAQAMLMLDQLSRNRTAHIDINAFASLTVAAGTPGTIRTYLPGQIGGRSVQSAGRAAAPAGAVPMAAPPALGMTVPAPVIIIQSPMVGNPAHVADAVLDGYNRAVRLNGPRQVTPQQVPA
jgi:flavin-binding protein dodecin